MICDCEIMQTARSKKLVKFALITAGFSIFGIGGAAVAGFIAFFVVYFGCRAIVWATHDVNEMLWTWSLIAIEPAALLAGFLIGTVLYGYLFNEKELAKGDTNELK
jgi:O-antigen/teichoic acid export membrane protein